MTDLNIVAEDFYCHLFNLTYGYNLINANFSKSNEKAIDLVDKESGIAIQITSTKTAKKTKETVEKFIEDEKHLCYPKLIIFNILKKSQHKESSYGNDSFSLNTKSDVWDYRNLTKKIESLDVKDQKNIYEYFLDQFEPISIASRRIPFGYRHLIRNFKLNYTVSHSNNIVFGGRENEIKALGDWLNNSDKVSRLLLFSVAGRGKSSLVVNWLNTVSVDWNVVFMPISIRFETNSPIIFFESIACQLANILDIDLQSPEYSAVDYFREKAIELLDTIQSQSIKVLIVIDGLDEATGWELGQSVFSNITSSTIKIVVSARLIANKNENDWADQLNWTKGNFDLVEVPQLSKEGIKGILSSVRRELFSDQVIDSLSTELYRLTSGEPLLLNLYVVDLMDKAKAGEKINCDILSKCDPGFSAYFKKWMSDQEKMYGTETINDRTKTVLAILACAIAPLKSRDLEALTSYINNGMFYIDCNTFKLINRFVIGDGVDSGYALNHPLFADFLKYEYFKESRRLDDARKAYLLWGAEILRKCKHGTAEEEQIPRYLLDNFSQHMKDNNCSLTEFDGLLCREWQQSHLSTNSRHFGFLKDIEYISNVATEMYGTGEISLSRRLQTEFQCAIYKSSLFSMGSNVPGKLRYNALKSELLTVNQAAKQIELLPHENRRDQLIDIYEFLSSESQRKLIFETINDPIEKNRANNLIRLSKFCEAPMRRSLVDNAYELIQKEDNSASLVHKLVELSEIDTEYSERYLSEALVSLSMIEDSGSRAMQRVKLSKALKKSDAIQDVVMAVQEIEGIKDSARKLRMFMGLAVEVSYAHMDMFIDKIEATSKSILGSAIAGSQIDVFILEEAKEAMIFCEFLKELNSENINFIVSKLKTYVEPFKHSTLHYQQAGTILSVYRIIKSINTHNNKCDLEELETDILKAFCNMPSGNNITHKIADYIEFLTDANIRIEAITRALVSSELIDDESSTIGFLTALAQASENLDFRNELLGMATNLANTIMFAQNRFDALLKISKVYDGSRKEAVAKMLLDTLKVPALPDMLVRWYSSIFESMDVEVTNHLYPKMIETLKQHILSSRSHAWIMFNALKRHLKEEDKILLFHLAMERENTLDGKIMLLKDVKRESVDEYVDKFKSEARNEANQEVRGKLLAELGYSADSLEISEESLKEIRQIDDPEKCSQALLMLDRQSSDSLKAEIFENVKSLINNIDDDSVKIKCITQSMYFRDVDANYIEKKISDAVSTENSEYIFNILDGASGSLSKAVCNTQNIVERICDASEKYLAKGQQDKILLKLFSVMNESHKQNVYSQVLAHYTCKNRGELLGFIGKNISFFYDRGGEELLSSSYSAASNAIKWYP